MNTYGFPSARSWKSRLSSSGVHLSLLFLAIGVAFVGMAERRQFPIALLWGLTVHFYT
jgi:hypothetical protein